MPPRPGFIAVTDSKIIFHGRALSKVTYAIAFNDISRLDKHKAGGFLKRDTALTVHTVAGTQYDLNFVVGFSKARNAI